MSPRSPRLHYTRLTEDGLRPLLEIATDEHVRRYLLDGEVVDADWCAATLEASDSLFDERQVGLWMVAEHAGAEPFGFGGYFVFPEIGPEPQLLFALPESFSGRGYATEIGQALLELAWELGWERVESAADGPNAASLRALEKLGFQKIEEMPGAFGAIHVLERLRPLH
ncbi:hypothetical protein ABI59_08045 [Acidobacteria bacterium Mor1]|nr:hypothetical protein ABI59_08045 [Acidobacteria bacterium Mor1]